MRTNNSLRRGPRVNKIAELRNKVDYIRLAAPEPEVLAAIGHASIKRGTDMLTERQIERVIKQARASRKHAAP